MLLKSNYMYKSLKYSTLYTNLVQLINMVTFFVHTVKSRLIEIEQTDDFTLKSNIPTILLLKSARPTSLL